MSGRRVKKEGDLNNMATMEEYIKDFSGRILGIIKTETNGDKTAIDFPSRRVLGYYKKQYDHTTDFVGRVISRGDTVVSFIYNK